MALRSIEDLLAHQAQLAGLEEDDRALLAGCAHLVVVAAGTVLAREGDPADSFYVVRSGRVGVEARAPGTAVRIDTLGPGDLVGWSWLFPPHRWHFDVRTIDESRLIEVDGACIRQKCERDHEFGHRLMTCVSAVLVDRLVSARLRLLDLYGTSS